VSVWGDWARGALGQARLKLDMPAKAEADCSKALVLEPGHRKALVRRAVARRELKKVSDRERERERESITVSVRVHRCACTRVSRLIECTQDPKRGSPPRDILASIGCVQPSSLPPCLRLRVHLCPFWIAIIYGRALKAAFTQGELRLGSSSRLGLEAEFGAVSAAASTNPTGPPRLGPCCRPRIS